MTFTRRQFIINTSGAIVTMILPLNKLFAQSNGGTFTLLRRNVGTFENRGGVIGWLASQDALIVVDTQFPDSAKLCWNGLQKKAERNIDVLLNTHHHGDHTAGNYFFKDFTSRIVGHENVPILQKKAAEQRGNLDTQIYANETFTESWKETVGNETITATYFGPAHTSGDSIIHFENANVVHMGDLIFNRIPPYIDRPAGANIRNWIEILEKIHEKYSDETIFIFGHGNPEFGITGMRKDLLAMRNFLSGLLEYTQNGIKESKSKEEIAMVEKLPDFQEYFSDNREDGISRCLSIAYDELTNAPR